MSSSCGLGLGMGLHEVFSIQNGVLRVMAPETEISVSHVFTFEQIRLLDGIKTEIVPYIDRKGLPEDFIPFPHQIKIGFFLGVTIESLWGKSVCLYEENTGILTWKIMVESQRAKIIGLCEKYVAVIWSEKEMQPEEAVFEVYDADSGKTMLTTTIDTW